MKLYLAGPMRGLPEFNFPAFKEARERLREGGHDVWCPAEHDAREDGFDGSGQPITLDYRHYMRRDLPAVLDSDAVAVLPGWERSKGARMEVDTARGCGIPVLDAKTLEPVCDSARTQFWGAICAEIDHAYRKHGRAPWGRHEFYGILKEEVDELWDEIRRDGPTVNVLAEAVQVAAMCLRYSETGDNYRGEHPAIPVRRAAERGAGSAA